MRKFAVIFSAVLLLSGLAGAAHAYTINYDYINVANQYTTPYSATVEDFDGALVWTWTGSGDVVSGSVGGQYSAPGGVDGINKDSTYYVTVPQPYDSDHSGSYMPTGMPAGPGPGGTYNYFGLWWGSVDTYNTLSFYNGATLVASITGSGAITPSAANGNQTAPSTNLYINFLDLPNFDSFKMTSTQFAFEADNIAIGYNPSRVPEPTTLLLLGLGLIGLAGVRRKS